MPEGLCLGKLPARSNAVKFKFRNYLAGTQAIQFPADFGHEEWSNPPIAWGMYGNDFFGDCVIAGGAHEEVLWNRMGGSVIGFNTSDLLRDFTAITGEAPGPDNGADMQMAASYRRSVGLLDASGTRRKIAAYLEIQPGNLQELYTAMYLFGAVGVGIQFPSYAFAQFSSHQSWHIVSGGTIEGGHYIPAVALRSNIVVVTWGRFQAMRPSFFSAYCDEAIAYVTQESLVNGKSPEGFNYAQLTADLEALNG
jgi:hypothetical protein